MIKQLINKIYFAIVVFTFGCSSLQIIVEPATYDARTNAYDIYPSDTLKTKIFIKFYSEDKMFWYVYIAKTDSVYIRAGGKDNSGILKTYLPKGFYKVFVNSIELDPWINVKTNDFEQSFFEVE